MSKNRPILQIALSLVLFILSLAGAVSAENIPEKSPCREIVSLAASETWSAYSSYDNVVQCFEIYVPAPGVLTLEVAAGAFVQGTSQGAVTLKRSANHRVVAFRSPGDYFVHLTALGSYELQTHFQEARIESDELYLESEAAGYDLVATQNDFYAVGGSLLFSMIAIRPAQSLLTPTKTEDEEVDPDPAGIRTPSHDPRAVSVDLILFAEKSSRLLAKTDDEEVDPDPAGITVQGLGTGSTEVHGLVRVFSPLSVKTDDEEVDPDPAGLRVGSHDVAPGSTHLIKFSAANGSFLGNDSPAVLLEWLVDLVWPVQTDQFQLHLYAPLKG